MPCSFGVFSEARALPSLLASSCDTRHTHNHRHTMRASTSVPVCMDLGEQLTACSRRQRQHTIASLDGLPLLHWMVCKQPERGSAAPCEQGARHQKGAQTLLPLLTRGANGRQRNARMPEATHVTLFLPAAHVTVFCRQHNLNRTPATHLTPATFLMLGNVYNAGNVANTGNVANAGVRRRCYRGSVPNAAAFQGSMLVPALPFAVCAFSCLLRTRAPDEANDEARTGRLDPSASPLPLSFSLPPSRPKFRSRAPTLRSLRSGLLLLTLPLSHTLPGYSLALS